MQLESFRIYYLLFIGLDDRQLMVVDSKMKLLTARVFPHMVLIEVSLSSSSLTLTYPGLPPLTVELPSQPGQAQPGYAVFREEVAGCDLGDQEERARPGSHWSSSYITVLSLVQSCLVMKYFLSEATPALFCHKEPAQGSNVSLWHKRAGSQSP